MINIYSYTDYLSEERSLGNNLFKKIKYKFQVLANKNHICEVCGCEIHKNEYYYIYKPLPEYNKLTKTKVYNKWRKRCIDHEPKSYSELDEINSLERIY